MTVPPAPPPATGKIVPLRPACAPADPAPRPAGPEPRGDAVAALAASPRLQRLLEELRPLASERLAPDLARKLPRKEVARQMGDLVMERFDRMSEASDLLEQRNLVTLLINHLLSAETVSDPLPAPLPQDAAPAAAPEPMSPPALLPVTPLPTGPLPVGPLPVSPLPAPQVRPGAAGRRLPARSERAPAPRRARPLPPRRRRGRRSTRR